MRNKKVLANCILAALVSSQANAEVFFSQYVEGGSFNKAVEIANSDSSELALTGYKLQKLVNGDITNVESLSLDAFTIPAGGVIVFSHADAAANEIIDVSSQTNESISNFNGDDPLILRNAADEIIDYLGVTGGESFGADKTLVRIESATIPSAIFIETDWKSLPKDDYTGLGVADLAPAPVAFTCLDNDNEPQFTTIQAIQGYGSTSPFIDGYPYITSEDHYVQGIVSAITTGLTQGFYLNALVDDNDPLTSEGLFVHTEQSTSALSTGDVVCVKGKIQENYNLTQLSVSDSNWVVQSQQAAPTAVPVEVIASDSNFRDTLERYEGMLVELDADLDMRVTRTFGYDYSSRRNNMVVSHQRVNMHPNQLFAAGSIEADMQSEENTQRRLFIESDEKAANGVVPFYPDFGRTDIDGNGSTEDYIRIDDTITGLQGVLTYSYNEYRLIAQNTITSTDLIRNQLRTDAPVLEKGDLRIATFNVLNYFNSPFGGSDNQFGSNRGAKTEPEFLIQEAKIVNAIISLDADIVGLMEIENNGFSNEGAIQQLVNKINAGLNNTDKHYRFVSIDSNKDNAINELDSVGTDSIAVGVIYRESAVENTNNQVIQMPSQQAPQVLDEDGDVIESGINYQRDAIASTFRVLGGNKLLTVAVNHFKSKGSKCWEDAAPEADGGQAGNDPDQQGSCERFRVAAADALGKALNEIEGHTLILGDLNSYAKEDAILILTDYSEELYGKEIFAARDTFIGDTEQYPDTNVDDINKLKITTNYGYINAVEKVHPINWSYSYNDEVGSLDYILVSESLKNRIVDATDWHINAAESTLLDYNTQYKGDLPSYSDQFRSSDHDPAIVELQIYARDSGTDDGNKPDKDAGSIQTFILLLLSFLALIRVRKSRK